MNTLKILRILTNLTQYEIAEKAEMSQSKYSAIERGYWQPSTNDKQRIAATLGVDIALLWSDGEVHEKGLNLRIRYDGRKMVVDLTSQM